MLKHDLAGRQFGMLTVIKKTDKRDSLGEEQANNQRTNRILAHGGETLTMAQWADRAGLKYKTLATRIYKGETLPDALRPAQQRAGGAV